MGIKMIYTPDGHEVGGKVMALRNSRVTSSFHNHLNDVRDRTKANKKANANDNPSNEIVEGNVIFLNENLKPVGVER